MLGPGDDYFPGITLPDFQHPGPPALPENGSGLSMEPAVGDAFVNTGLNDNMNFLTDLKMLYQRRYRW